MTAAVAFFDNVDFGFGNAQYFGDNAAQMDWMNDNGHINEDQIAMVKYYEDKMDVKVGNEDAQ